MKILLLVVLMTGCWSGDKFARSVCNKNPEDAAKEARNAAVALCAAPIEVTHAQTLSCHIGVGEDSAPNGQLAIIYFECKK